MAQKWSKVCVSVVPLALRDHLPSIRWAAAAYMTPMRLLNIYYETRRITGCVRIRGEKVAMKMTMARR